MTSDKIRMLSIDDQSVTTSLDRAGYRKMGVTVMSAKDLGEAKQILNKQAVDVVVVNRDYLKINVIQILRFLKQHDKWFNIPVVVTSVLAGGEATATALDAGASLYVEQPIPREFFIEKLKKLIAHQTRSDGRQQLEGTAKIVLGSLAVDAGIADVSDSGVLLLAEQALPLDSVVQVFLQLGKDRKPIEINGLVVRHLTASSLDDPRPGLGIRFTDFVSDGKSRLEDHLKSLGVRLSRVDYYM